MPSWFEYPVTRPFTLKRFNVIFIISAVVWCTLITLLSIATVGYETYQINSEKFNVPYTMWYDRIFPKIGWFPEGRTCEGSIIKPSESNFLFLFC